MFLLDSRVASTTDGHLYLSKNDGDKKSPLALVIARNAKWRFLIQAVVINSYRLHFVKKNTSPWYE